MARSGGGNRRSVYVLSAYFTTFGGEELHELLVMVENLLQNFCVPCCSGWCWIFRRDTVYHILLMLKFGGKEVRNVLHSVGLVVAGLFQS